MSSKLAGTNIIAKIVPFADTDEYPTHDEKYGLGGYRTIEAEGDIFNSLEKRRLNIGSIVHNKGKSLKMITDVENEDAVAFPFLYPEQGLKFYTDFDNDKYYELKLNTEGDKEFLEINKDGNQLLSIREDGVLKLEPLTEFPTEISANMIFAYDNETYLTYNN